jgi:hypothetical protein
LQQSYFQLSNESSKVEESIIKSDHSWSDINKETIDLAAKESMQFGHALDRILREILLANPALGSVHLMKSDIADGFYLHVSSNDGICDCNKYVIWHCGKYSSEKNTLYSQT